MERLMLLDGNGLIYRGYFALPPLTTSRGQLVNAVFGFCSIVLRGIQDIGPEYVAVAFDLSAPTFRHEAYADYKATRQRMPDDLRDQFPMVREVVAALRIPVYEKQGYEADDVIGTLTLEAEARGLDTTIVTGDLDMLQLVTDRTRLMTTRSGVQNTVIYDPARIRERYGLEPAQMVDFKALKGDSTDNIPGVPGVGEKTAARLIATFGSLDALFEQLDDVTPEKLRLALAEARDRVVGSRELLRIVRDVPVSLDLEAARLKDYDRDTVLRLFREFEFRTLIERLPPVAGERAEETASALGAAAADVSFPAAKVVGRPEGWGPGGDGQPSPSAQTAGRRGGGTTGPSGLQLTLDFASLAPAGSSVSEAPAGGESTSPARPIAGDPRAALAAALGEPTRIERVDLSAVAGLRPWIESAGELAVALVPEDPRPLRGGIVALGVAAADGRALATDGPDASEALLGLIREVSPALVGHEVKPLVVRAIVADPIGRPPRVVFDTQVAAYLLNASLRSQSIGDVVLERVDLVLPQPGDLPAPERAGLEALAALAVRGPLAAALADASLDRLFDEIERPLIPILARMEAVGVALDRAALAVLDAEFGAEIARLEEEIFASVGHEFTIGSPKQLGDILFAELGLPKGKKTKTGYSTDASVLEELRGVHPVVERVLDWRVFTKLRSTYVEALPTLLAHDGRLHTTFHQAVAATGRLSSSDPNLQNIPIRTPLGRRIRRAFVAGGPDVTLVAADYSQIELRILAHVSGDEHLRDAFARRADIHRETAARVLHKAPEDVTADERSMAKMVNFGIAYGMSDFGLSSRAGISRQEASEFIDSYFATYSGISYYMLHIKEVARRQGFVTTLLGRKRSIPELEARNPSLRGAGERMAINMPIQGTAADIIKIAMIRLAAALDAGGFRARLLLQVHDELLLEVPRDEAERLVPVLREAMEHALPLDVPLTVDVKIGDDWESMTPLTAADAAAAEASEAPEALSGAPSGAALA
ncbi:MAG TPA: DNA polymerase I [Candidatus Limnocylindrales bacterium]